MRGYVIFRTGAQAWLNSKFPRHVWGFQDMFGFQYSLSKEGIRKIDFDQSFGFFQNLQLRTEKAVKIKNNLWKKYTCLHWGSHKIKMGETIT